jgi:hypothetical protein
MFSVKLFNLGKMVISFLFGKKMINQMPAQKLQILVWTFISMFLFTICAFLVFIFNMIDVSTILSFTRWNLYDVEEVNIDQFIGEWKIEYPYPGPLVNFDMRNWEKTRLIFHKNGNCTLIEPTQYMMLNETFHDSSEIIGLKKKAIGKKLYGKYEIITSNQLFYPQIPIKKSCYLKVRCCLYSNHMRIMQVPVSYDKNIYRLVMDYAIPSYDNYCDGIIWKRCEKSEKNND